MLSNGARLLWPILLLTLCLVPSSGSAASSQKDEYSAVGAGIRMHAEHKDFSQLPYASGDLSYGLTYQWHNPKAYILVGLDYTPALGKRDSNTNSAAEANTAATEDTRGEAKSVLTPALGIIAKDKLYRGGVSVLRSLVTYEDGDDWTPIYWQFMLGINLPIMLAGVDLQAFYTFEKWDKLADFKGDEIEFGVALNFSF